MKKNIWLAICFLGLVQPVWSQISTSQVENLIRKWLPKGSDVGIAVYDLSAEKPLFSYRADQLSRPASTMKLLTAITSLQQEGGMDPFRTEVWHDGWIENDTLHGNLYVVGGFDPELGAQQLDTLVDKTLTYPFSVVQGRLYGDVSMKDSLYWGNGWLWDDNPEAYQPYLSPLMLAKGTVELDIRPAAQVGESPYITATPASSYYIVVNEAQSRCPEAGKLSVTRNWLTNGNRIVVRGNVSAPIRKSINVYDSASFFMHTFWQRLRERGIEIADTYAFAELPEQEVTLMACHETPIQQVLDQLMKESDNLNAEALLYRMASKTSGKKYVSAKDGLLHIEAFIRVLGHQPKDYKVADGSGLSQYNYLSPRLLVDFLRLAYQNAEIFSRLYPSLPLAGIDGTLQHRMKEGRVYRNVRAKTGSFTGINALAGYLKRKNGHWVAFAIMNQNVLSASKAREFQNAICRLLAD